MSTNDNPTDPGAKWKEAYLALANKESFPTCSEVLQSLPAELHPQWESYMRGKTCPHVHGEPGVYPWDLLPFLGRVTSPPPSESRPQRRLENNP